MKKHISLTSKERQKLKQLFKRKLISVKAHQQIGVILKFDEGATVVEVAEYFAFSYQTLKKWRVAFEKDRIRSLIVYIEKFIAEDDIDDIDESQDGSEEDSLDEE